jgi:hypothetical protein
MARDSFDGTSHPLVCKGPGWAIISIRPSSHDRHGRDAAPPLIRVGEKLQVKAVAVSVD